MANELTLYLETSPAISMTCANTTGIEKGTILTLSDPFTAAMSVASGAIVAGVAAEEKIANDGKTTISVFRGGVFKAVASGSITVGDPLIIGNLDTLSNTVMTAPVNSKNTFGTALETASDTESLLIELKPGVTSSE